MKAWEHSGFNFFAGEPIGAADKAARLFLALYLKKAPLALERLSIDESGTEPIVRYTKPLDDDQPNDEMIHAFSSLEFLAELSAHIPNTWEQTTRFYGVYSPRTRGAKRRDERFQKLVENNFEPLNSPLPARAPPQFWHQRVLPACMRKRQTPPPLSQTQLPDHPVAPPSADSSTASNRLDSVQRRHGAVAVPPNSRRD